ncbi:MAG: TolC family protein [Porticoccaceae bacterium]|nr:TolC family protein [Pseudomonadales bacterium]MCP5172095.1 TolC family protein [Pseudomonadales bacterium]
MKIFFRCLLAVAITVSAADALSSTIPASTAQAPSIPGQKQLSLDQAVEIARSNDPWIAGSRFRQQATEAESIAAAQLPDPVLSFGAANLPVDNFDFNQEPMTQFKVGVSQVFPRGDSRELKKQQLDELGDQHPYMRQNRRAMVAVTVSKHWLDIYRYQESIRLIERDRALFEHLVDVAESSYTSAAGKTRQQDFVRAQLELTRLEDRLATLRQQEEMAQAKLSEWLSPAVNGGFDIEHSLPELELLDPDAAKTKVGGVDDGYLVALLLAHPSIKSLDQKIVATTTGVQLAEQKYKPQWNINASYGYRDDDPMGQERSDFFSLGVSFDLPLFTADRQDKEVQAAIAMQGAIRTEKALALRLMRARFQSSQRRLHYLEQRRRLYQERLLLETHDQAEASLAAYTSDDGDFAEVVRARIAELNANIDFLNINVDRLQTIAELNYFFIPASQHNVVGVYP